MHYSASRALVRSRLERATTGGINRIILTNENAAGGLASGVPQLPARERELARLSCGEFEFTAGAQRRLFLRGKCGRGRRRRSKEEGIRVLVFCILNFPAALCECMWRAER